MRSIAIFLAFAIVGAMLVLGASRLTSSEAQVRPTPTADPLFWSGCKNCDRQQQRIQATAATLP